jgi:hypothetical protein
MRYRWVYILGLYLRCHYHLASAIGGLLCCNADFRRPVPRAASREPRAMVFGKLETKFKGVAVPRAVYYSGGVMNQVAAAQVDMGWLILQYRKC